jgi:exodeoxyribonuclease V alpha subunit
MAITLSESQNEAVDVLRNNRLCLFTGPPGSGKTTTLSHWMKDVDISGTRCFAPTGKAAQRMMESFGEAGVSLPATTIHCGLIPNQSGYDGSGWGFYYNESRRLPYKRIVVDESSMADNAVMSWLLQSVADGCQVILIGDPDQLPPVSKGKPFMDMIESGVVPHAKLTEIHRFAGRIAHVCQRINAGKTFTPSPKIDLDINAGEFGPENIRHVERPNGSMSLSALDAVCLKIAERGFDPIRDMQVIVSRNDQGPVNRELVNLRLQSLLNPDGFRVDNCPFRVGDNIMCLRNGMRKIQTLEFGGPMDTKSLTYVANGESGEVEYVNESTICCRFGSDLVSFRKSSWNREVCLAYAITAHKSQGGGWPVVVYLIDETRLNDRSLIYTAISRSKTLCITIGRMSTLTGQIKRVKVRERKTFLKEMIRELSP